MSLILLRHGQSVWNLENRFTGFQDIGLSKKGIEEAKEAGKKLKSIPVDAVFTSVLQRAVHTAEIVAQEIGFLPDRMVKNGALNERSYGQLEGLNKDQVRAQYGNAQVHLWRRSYDVAPPGGESLKETCNRVIPYWEQAIKPLLKQGKTVLVVAHGNSLRALIKEITHLDEKQIVQVEIPTGIPIVYDWDNQGNVHQNRLE